MLEFVSNHDLVRIAETRPRGIFVTDFDGTLLRSDRTVSQVDWTALKRLSDHGALRVIATGRSLYSFNKVADPELPVDFVIFSTGAGICDYPSRRMLRNIGLEPDEVKQAVDVLLSAQLDFMIHDPIPENHRFRYHASGRPNRDFDRRLALYREFAQPLAGGSRDGFGPATQLVAVIPPEAGFDALQLVRDRLTDFSIIQTTSPLDGESTWIEIFLFNVSKGLTSSWLASRLGIDLRDSVSVGNDYNDLDLLEWAETSYVVANAPAALTSRFTCVASNDENGVAEAVERWLRVSRNQD
jgi:hydroxymethylpyrimidine pyrophosphatase-like HAD family hydrolase